MVDQFWIHFPIKLVHPQYPKGIEKGRGPLPIPSLLQGKGKEIGHGPMSKRLEISPRPMSKHLDIRPCSISKRLDIGPRPISKP